MLQLRRHVFSSGKDDWKKFKKHTLIMKVFVLILKKYILPTFQNTTQNMKNK